jgi:hypothetical protein
VLALPPEVTQNLNTTVGRLGLTDKEEDQIVAFLKALQMDTNR